MLVGPSLPAVRSMVSSPVSGFHPTVYSAPSVRKLPPRVTPVTAGVLPRMPTGKVWTIPFW